MVGQITGIHIQERNFDSERAALGHGIARVDGEIEQHLLHHAGISLHQGRLRKVIQLQRDVLAENARQHFGHVRDDFIQVEAARLHDLAAAESEQLARQGGGAFGGLGHLLGRAGGDTGEGAAGHEERSMAMNDGENIVEIMSDAARELADGLHFLRLTQLILEAFLGGDIAE